MRRHIGILTGLCWLLLVGIAMAADPAPQDGTPPAEPAVKPLRVGVVVAPPFVTKGVTGQFQGLSIDLWRDVAHDLGLTWKAREYDLIGLLDAVGHGEVDVGVSDLSITPERESVMDFSQPFYATGLGIAVPASNRGGILSSIGQRLLSSHVLLYAGSLLGLLLVVGTAIWLVERNRNRNNFRSGLRGIGDGLWWSAVTMTAVGYGDSTPRTLLGRTLAIVWMFASVTLLAFFTAGITSSLTVEHMATKVRGPEDLHRVRVGVKHGSAAEEELVASHVGVIRFDTVEDGMRATDSGEIEAFVHDQPVLQAIAYTTYPGRLQVLPITFDPQLYGFAFPSGSGLRKKVNVTMLRLLEDREYRRRLIGAYLGKDATY